MKKVILAAVLSLFAVGAMAQYRPSVIVSAGYQGANLNVKAGDVKMAGNKIKSGFRVGAAFDLPVVQFGAGYFSIQPGLYYSQKGTKSNTTFLNQTFEGATTLGYIELPILANLTFGFSDAMAVFVNAGPYLAYGIHSNSTDKVNILGINGKLENDKNLFAGKNGLKPFDAGLQVGAGLEFSRVQVGVGTQLGLVNMTRKENSSQTNSTFFVSLGYRF